MTPVLSPIDRPGLVMRIVHRIARWRFGKVLMPLRVIYSRAPALLTVGLHIEWIREHALGLEPELVALVVARVSGHHRCAFCVDLGQAFAIRRGISVKRFTSLDGWRDNPSFTARERSALAWVDDILDDGEIEARTIEEARAVFSERELIELTWVQASEVYFNMQTRPLRITSDHLVSAPPASPS